MAQIRILKDNDKNTVYPQSVTQAIVDANGVNLDTILHNTVMTDAEEDVADIIVGYEDINNKITEITEDSTDVQYPSAKAVYDLVTNQEVELNGYYTKEESSDIFASKEIYNDTAISLGRRTDTGSIGINSVATGDRTQANGNYSVAMGSLAQANAMAAVALGGEVRANGSYAVALGEGAVAKNTGEVAVGRWNIEDTTGKVLHSVGNGTSSSARSNAYTIDNEGNAWFAGDIYIGSNSGINKDEGSIRLARVNEIPSLEGDFSLLEAKLKLSTEYSEWDLSTKKIDYTYVSSPSDWTVSGNSLINNKNNLKLSMSAYQSNPIGNVIDGNDSTSAEVTGVVTLSNNVPFKVKKINATFRNKTSGTQNTYFSTIPDDKTLNNAILISASDYSSLAGNGTSDTYYIKQLYGPLDSYLKTDFYFQELKSITYEIDAKMYVFNGLDSINNGTTIKIKIPDNADNSVPTILKVGDIEQNMNFTMVAGGIYDLIYLNGSIQLRTFA